MSIFDNMPDFQSFRDNWQSSLPQDTNANTWDNSTPFATQVSPFDSSAIPQSSLASQMNAAASGSGGSGGGGGFWSGVDNVARNLPGWIGSYLGKLGQTLVVSGMDPIIGLENGSLKGPNTLEDIKNIWATPDNNVNQQRISQALNESPQLASQPWAPSKMLDVTSTLLSPVGEFSTAAKNGIEMMKPLASSLNAAARGETGLADAIGTAQNSAAQDATQAFNKNMANMQTQEAVNSAQKGNFSLADMLNRTPEAQNSFINTANDMAYNSPGGTKGSIPSLLNLAKQQAPGPAQSIISNLSRQYPPGFVPGNAYTGFLKDEGQAANRALGQLFNIAKEGNLPPGREYEALHDLWSRVAPKTAPGLDQLIEQTNKFRTNDQILNNATANTLQKFKVGAAPFQFKTLPETLKNANTFREGFKVGDSAIPTAADGTELSGPRKIIDVQSKDGTTYYRFAGDNAYMPEGQLKGVPSNPGEPSKLFTSAINKEMGKPVQMANKPFDNKFEDALDQQSIAQKLNQAVANAKGGAALDTLSQFAANKNPLQTLYSKGQDSFNRLFNLKGALGEDMPHYYDLQAAKDYRTGQAAQDIKNVFGKYSPQDLSEFRLARDAGEIGAGHKFEGLNSAYDALLNKYTGADQASGLERGTLNNYVPRIQDVDKGNLQAVKRSLGSDSLGGFAEDRTDKRSLRQIISDEGRDPYKNDMYDITLGRLQKSIAAQESRNFIDKMVSDGKAVKFENADKAFKSPQYNEATSGVYVDPITKEAHLMPKDTASFLNKENDFSEAKNYTHLLDGVNSIVRRLMITNPLVHFPHNILSSIPNALHEAGASGLDVLKPSFWSKGINASPETLDEMQRMGVLKPDWMPRGTTPGKDLAHEAQTEGMSPVKKWLSDMSYEAKTGSKMERFNDFTNTLARPLDAMTWKPEHAARVAVYQTAKEMGSTPEEAAQIINNHFGTNTKTMTPFEKNVMTRVVTFYPWLKHILVGGARNILNDAGTVGKTWGALNQENEDNSGHFMADNPSGFGLKVDLGQQDAKGNEIFVDPYLPTLEFAKAVNGPASFLYNRMSQPITTTTNLLANREYGPFSPSTKPIVDQGKVDAGLQSPLGARLNYIASRGLSGPTQELQALTGNVGNDILRSAISQLGGRTSTYSDSGAAAGLKIRGENAAKAIASSYRQQGLPIPLQLKKQEQGKLPFQLTNQ